MTLSRRQFIRNAGQGVSLAAVLPFGLQASDFRLQEEVSNDNPEIRSPKSETPIGLLTVGAASVDITGEPGPALAGFLLRVQPSTHVRTHLFARAIFIEKDGESLLWLVADSLGYSQDIVTRLKTELSRQLSLEPCRIVIAATHTHSAPAVSQVSSTGEYSGEYVETILVPGMIEAAIKAKQSAEPCHMIEATGEVDLSYDRRGQATKHTEKRVPAVGFRRDDGTFKAVLICYSMHPVCYSGGDIAAEWPGAVADAVHEMFSPDTEPFVLQGACGNLNPRQRNISDEEMHEAGQTIVQSVAEQLKTVKPVEPYFAMRTRHIAVLLEVFDEAGIDAFVDRHRKELADYVKGLEACDLWKEWALNELAQGGRDFIDTEIAAIVLGHRVFVTAPFETLSWMNTELAKHTTLDCFALGYTNGCYNYLPHDAAYDEGGYSPYANLWYRNFRCRRGELERLAENSARLAELAARVAGIRARSE